MDAHDVTQILTTKKEVADMNVKSNSLEMFIDFKTGRFQPEFLKLCTK